MPFFDVPGASLYYETVGEGPLLLCIAGANGSLEIWKLLADHLKECFKVAIYDRRGFSRSLLLGRQDYKYRLQTDADDAERLIRRLSPQKPVTVLGNSSGAIVALELLLRHPQAVQTLLCHEPPAIKLLPDSEAVMNSVREVYQTYRNYGVAPALEQFAEMVKAGEETNALLAAFDPRSAGPYAFGNALYWFEREFLLYPPYDFDVEAIKAQREKLVLLNANNTHKEALHHRTNMILSEKCGLPLYHMPGAHVGFAYLPAEWARKLFDVLRA